MPTSRKQHALRPLRVAHTPPNAHRVLREVNRLEKCLNDMEMIPATSAFRNAVLLALLSRSISVGKAVCSLVERNFPAEAFALSRTLIEIYFCVRYIRNRDTEARAETYVGYHARVRKEWRDIILKYYPKTAPSSIKLDDEVLEIAMGFKNKAHWTGHGGQARLMALEADTVERDERGEPITGAFDYDALYFWTSQFVRATVDGVEAHASQPGDVFRVHARPWIDKKRGQDALFNTVVFLSKAFVAAFRAMNEEQPAAFQSLARLLSEFADRAPAEVSAP